MAVLPERAALWLLQWERTISQELTTGQTVTNILHWCDRGTIKLIHPKALYCRWKEACRLAGVPERLRI